MWGRRRDRDRSLTFLNRDSKDAAVISWHFYCCF
jgi:hypothetical protein